MTNITVPTVSNPNEPTRGAKQTRTGARVLASTVVDRHSFDSRVTDFHAIGLTDIVATLLSVPSLKCYRGRECSLQCEVSDM